MKPFGILSVTVLTATLAFAAPEAKQQAKVTVVGVEVFSPSKADAGQAEVFGRRPGASVFVKIHDQAAYFLEVDKKRSELLRFADDRGTDLSKPRQGSRFGQQWLGHLTGISEGGHACVVQIASEKTPRLGAREIKLKANIAITCGSAARTGRQQAVALKPGSKLSAGPLTMTVGNVQPSDWGDVKMTVSFTSSQSLARIKELEFFAPDGKKIPHKLTGSGHGGFEGHMTYSRDYDLHRKVETASIRVTYFDKVETVVVPVDITTGIGIGGRSLAKAPDAATGRDQLGESIAGALRDAVSEIRAEVQQEAKAPEPQAGTVLFHDDFTGEAPKQGRGVAHWDSAGASGRSWRVEGGRLVGGGSGVDSIVRHLFFDGPLPPDVEILCGLSFKGGAVRGFGLEALYLADKKAYHYNLWRPCSAAPDRARMRLYQKNKAGELKEVRRVEAKSTRLSEGKPYVLKLARIGSTLAGSVDGQGAVSMDLADMPAGANLISLTFSARCNGGLVMLDSFTVKRLKRSAEGRTVGTARAKKASPDAAKKSPAPKPEQQDAESAAARKLSLAKLYRDHGLKDKAIEIYKGVLKDYPRTSAAGAAKKELEKLLPAPR